MNPCLCGDPERDHPGGECVHAACGCLEYRQAPAACDSGKSPATGTPPACICPRFSDTGGFRIADLCCPVHGTGGTDPGDGYWDDDTPAGTGGAA